MKHQAEQAKQTAKQLWRFFNDQEWKKAHELLSEDFEAYWPQSEEIIVGADNFIEGSRRHISGYNIRIQKSMYEYDQWDKVFTISLQVFLESKKHDGNARDHFVVSFFEIDRDGYIKSLTEYWTNNSMRLEWRKDLVQPK